MIKWARLLLALFLGGCITAEKHFSTSKRTGSRAIFNVPAEALRALLSQGTLAAGGNTFILAGEAEYIQMLERSNPTGKQCRLYLNPIPDASATGAELDCFWGDVTRDYGQGEEQNVFNAIKLQADVLAKQQEEVAFFEGARKYYKDAALKSKVPEEAHRFEVQAKFAVEQKRFEDAAARYADALRVAPWWPQARYNRAVILSKLSRYDEAIQEMKRYLLLVPNAPDARKAQDMIYAWESVPQ